MHAGLTEDQVRKENARKTYVMNAIFKTCKMSYKLLE